MEHRKTIKEGLEETGRIDQAGLLLLGAHKEKSITRTEYKLCNT